MDPDRPQESSLRLDRLDSTRLAWAFAISIAVHLLCIGTYHAGREAGLWQRIQLPQWMQRITALAETIRKESPRVPRDLPLVFVDVNPAFAAATPPENAKFYSDKNSRAANPDPDQDSDQPKLEGDQTEVPKAEDIPNIQKLQPTAPPQPPEPEEPPAPEPPAPPKPAPPPGDLAMVKPEPALRPETPAPPPPRPRTLKEAMIRDGRTQLAGRQMKQAGGVKRGQIVPSFDVKATPFGSYDAAVIEAIQQHWYNLLDQQNFAYERSGKVVLQFHLTYDGRVTDMKLVESTVGNVLALLCRRAVEEPAPFGRWPSDMRLMFGDTRQVQFTFLY